MQKLKYLLLILFFFTACKKTDLKTENKPLLNSETQKNLNFKELHLNIISKDDILEKCENENLKFKLNYENNNNSVIISLNEESFIHNFGFNFEGIGSNAVLFENDNRKIFILEFEYEYSVKFLVFNISNNSVSFLEEMEFEISSDGNSKVKFELSEIKNILQVLVLNQKREIDINSGQNLKLATKLDSEINYQNTNLEINKSWALNCKNELTVLNINDNKGYLSLNNVNPTYINIKLEKTNNNEYLLKFLNMSSQKIFYEDELILKDENISKEKTIGKIKLIKNGSAELQWNGLFNTVTNQYEFVGKDFLFIRENNGKNPIILEECL